ncbi:MAG TPA: hypothetical protein VKB25_15260, partial [Conexibacter sp.]|nr:hypothetical protein [Conexibacter sp.]
MSTRWLLSNTHRPPNASFAHPRRIASLSSNQPGLTSASRESTSSNCASWIRIMPRHVRALDREQAEASNDLAAEWVADALADFAA